MSMLMNIPRDFTPALLRLMMELGHGEELLICDANFPYLSVSCQKKDLVHITGCPIPQLLEEVLRFFPLDQSVESAAMFMGPPPNGFTGFPHNNSSGRCTPV